MRYIYLIVISLLCVFGHATFASNTRIGDSCDLHETFGTSNKKAFLEFDAALRNALRDNNAAATSLLISFPLNVTDADDNSVAINNAQTLQVGFDKIFTKTVRQAVLSQNLNNLYCMYDQLSYNDGKAEVDVGQVNMGKIKVFRVIAVDILNGGLRSPNTKYLITYICHTPKYEILIDTKNDENFRYRAWIRPHNGTDKPDLEIDTGTVETQGSDICGYNTWKFKNGKTEYSVQELGCTDGSQPEGAIGSVDISVAGRPLETLWCYK